MSGESILTVDVDVDNVREKWGSRGDVDVQARQAEIPLHNNRMAASSVVEAFLTTRSESDTLLDKVPVPAIGVIVKYPVGLVFEAGHRDRRGHCGILRDGILLPQSQVIDSMSARYLAVRSGPR
jgi:hypothetical protein